MSLTFLGGFATFLIGHIEGVDAAPSTPGNGEFTFKRVFAEVSEGGVTAFVATGVLGTLSALGVGGVSPLIATTGVTDTFLQSLVGGLAGAGGGVFGYTVNSIGVEIRGLYE